MKKRNKQLKQWEKNDAEWFLMDWEKNDPKIIKERKKKVRYQYFLKTGEIREPLKINEVSLLEIQSYDLGSVL